MSEIQIVLFIKTADMLKMMDWKVQNLRLSLMPKEPILNILLSFGAVFNSLLDTEIYLKYGFGSRYRTYIFLC